MLVAVGALVLGSAATLGAARVLPRSGAPAPIVVTPLSRAQGLFDAGDDAGAEEAAMTAAALDGADPRPHLLLSRIHLRRGAPERARVELARVLALEPAGPRADEARTLLSTLP